MANFKMAVKSKMADKYKMAPASFQPIWVKICMHHLLVRPKGYHESKMAESKMATKFFFIFQDQIYFSGRKFFSRLKLFYDTIFFPDPNFWGTQIFGGIKFFWGPKLYWDPNLFREFVPDNKKKDGRHFLGQLSSAKNYLE